jgi:hypothetical protein
MIEPDRRLTSVVWRRRLAFSFSVRSTFGSIAMAVLWLATDVARGDDRGWDFQPYRIKAVIALDVTGGLAEKLARELPRHLRERAEGAVGPLWSFEAQLASGVLRHSVLSDLRKADSAAHSKYSSPGDKLLLIAVESHPGGFRLTAREFDHYVQRWSMPIQRESRQCDLLAEQAFVLAEQAIAPIARVEADPNNAKQVVLHPRGANLLSSAGGTSWTKPGDVFQPMLRRTTRGGELAENGIQPVPWTYLEVVSVDNAKVVSQIHSGSRRPFGIRRAGRVEQLAIALRTDAGETQLRLHSRTNFEKPLVGYELYAQKPGEETTTRIGASDTAGRITIRAGAQPVQTLFIKHGGQLLARLPVVPGAETEVSVPLPDDDMRLEAEARLAAMREELVDVVARRNILMARARQKIEQKDFEAAQELVRAVDQLPGRSQFNLTLTTASRLLRSDDPQIQRRIDQLFQATQTVLSQYLDARAISELHEDLRAAQRKQ